ncbi:helix-turn-helix domain-containing protein [Agromyces bauzanensis]
MGFQSTTLAFAVTGLSGPQKAVLVALAHCRNDETGRCHPGHTTLARMTALGEKTVRRALASLEELGRISRAEVTVGNERKGTDYVLNLAQKGDAPGQSDPPVRVTGGSERPEGGVVGVTAGVVRESQTPGQSDHLTGREQEGTGRDGPPPRCDVQGRCFGTRP